MNTISTEHIKFTGKWIANLKGNHYNLKKTRVSDVCSSNEHNMDDFIDKDFLKYLNQYKSNLVDLYANVVLNLVGDGILINGRVKNDDSILLKLHRKRFEDGGKFALNKYLNDLLGFRIIDTDYEKNIELVDQLALKSKQEGMRLLHKPRENGDYRGYHIYFQGKDSKSFPVELQIWNAKNEQSNLTSHETYKKDYAFWPNIYKKG